MLANLITSLFLHNCDNVSQCGIQLMPCWVSNNPCALFHTRVAIYCWRPKADDGKCTVFVLTLTIIQIYAVLHESEAVVLLHQICWVNILSESGRFVCQPVKNVPLPRALFTSVKESPSKSFGFEWRWALLLDLSYNPCDGSLFVSLLTEQMSITKSSSSSNVLSVPFFESQNCLSEDWWLTPARWITSKSISTKQSRHLVSHSAASVIFRIHWSE